MKNFLLILIAAIAGFAGGFLALNIQSTDEKIAASEQTTTNAVIPEEPVTEQQPKTALSDEQTESVNVRLKKLVGLMQKMHASDKQMSEKLDGLEEISLTFEERFESIETELDRLGRDLEANRLANMDQSPATVEEEYQEPVQQDLDSGQVSAKVLQQQAVRQQYFLDLDNTITTNADDGLSQQITASYEELISSDQSWTEGVSLNSVSCGGDYCKVVINYPLDMDPMAQFELDGRVYMQAIEHLGQSTTKEYRRQDGTMDLEIYFAKQGAELPVLP